MPVDSAHDLYGLPLERFIPERTALAKALRAQKRRDEATEVTGRRKPSVAAWAVNQLVRTQGKQVAELFAAGDDLADAQTGAAEGRRTAEQMRGAMRRQRDAIDRLLELARGLLSQDGHSLTQQTLDRVADTLRAASIDPDSREQVQSGCLTQELRFAGLGIGGSGSPATPPRRRPQNRKTPTAKDAEAQTDANAEREAAERAAAEEKQRKEALRLARRVEREARRAATRAEKELQAAESERDEARHALDHAEQRLTAAAETYEAASAELQKAEAAVNGLSPGEDRSD